MNIYKSLKMTLEGEAFVLFAEKAMYWEKQETLFIADLHLGKAGHFRKQGIPVPEGAGKNNFNQLDTIIAKSKCSKIVFLGDLFHSCHNKDCDTFVEWRSNHKEINMSLIMGNHDVLNSSFYAKAQLTTMLHLSIDPFLFTHKPLDGVYTDYYNIAGHVHPGIKLYGKARQSLSLACFYFGKSAGLMPSFGSFTGNSIIRAKEEDMVYVVADNEIKRVL